MTGVQTCALPICFPVTIGGPFSFLIEEKEDDVMAWRNFWQLDQWMCDVAKERGGDLDNDDEENMLRLTMEDLNRLEKELESGEFKIGDEEDEE